MDWVYPSDVRGWLSEVEARKLAELARGKRVLEIGSFCGKSAISMAQTAESVTCIDPFDGRATAEPGDTLPEFIANTGRYGVGLKIATHRGATVDIAPKLEAGCYDLVFIDGAHDRKSIDLDKDAAERLLRPGGLIAFHDYRRLCDPEVTEAVDAYIAQGADLLDCIETIAIVKPLRHLSNGAVRQARQADKVKPLVFLGLPSYDGKCSLGAAEAYYVGASLGGCEILRARANSSFLTKTFNDLWCSALNHRAQGVTHFAMIHADIIPAQHGWLDVLMGELVRLDADVMSAISPIKSEHGWTSTAVANDLDDPWLSRRLTLHDVYKLPMTFGSEDVGRPLLLNTGLWVCRLDRPWCEQVCFDVFNRIVRKNGRWHSEAISEDWLFSAALNRLGAKIYATRKVTLGHDGCKVFTTDSPWGTQSTDEVYQRLAKERGLDHAEDQVHEGLSGEGCGVGREAPREAVAGRA